MDAAELRKRIKQAHHNYHRQRAKEIERRDVRVSSMFWHRAERDYRRELGELYVMGEGLRAKR